MLVELLLNDEICYGIIILGLAMGRTLNELEHHLSNITLMIELAHLNFGLERTNIEPKRPSLDLLNHSSNRL